MHTILNSSLSIIAQQHLLINQNNLTITDLQVFDSDNISINKLHVD